jgi:hypothetical protein
MGGVDPGSMAAAKLISGLKYHQDHFGISSCFVATSMRSRVRVSFLMRHFPSASRRYSS